MNRYKFEKLDISPALVNAARSRAITDFTRNNLTPEDPKFESYVRQSFETQANSSINVHRDGTADATGPVVFSVWRQRLEFERPTFAPPIFFNSIGGSVTISRPAEFASLPENFDGDVILRLDRGLFGRFHEDAFGVREWLNETLAQMMVPLIRSSSATSPENQAKRRGPERC